MSKEHLFCEFETSQQANPRHGWKTSISAMDCKLLFRTLISEPIVLQLHTGETPILGYGLGWGWPLTVMLHPHNLN